MTTLNTREQFKAIEGFPNHRVSNFGRIQTRQIRGTTRLGEWRDMRLFDVNGYYGTEIRYLGRKQNVKAHRLVAQYFIPNPENKTQVNHIDANKKNNHIANLEWCTPGENVTHAFRLGLVRRQGVHNGGAELDNEAVIIIKQLIEYGFRNQDIADLFKIANNTVSAIRTGDAWTHLAYSVTKKELTTHGIQKNTCD